MLQKKHKYTNFGEAMVSLEQLGNLNYLPLPVWVLNPQGQFVQANTAFCTLFGIIPEELSGPNPAISFTEEDKAFIDQFFKNPVPGKEFLNKEWEIKTKYGNNKFIMSNLIMATDHLHEPIMVLFGTDISSVIKTEAKYRSIIREREKEFELRETTEDMLLHDVRKPVANIISICSLMGNKGYDKQKTEYWLEVLHGEANKSLKILDTKAGIKRLELKNYELELSNFNLLELIKSILIPLEPNIQKCSLQVKLYLNNMESQEQDILMMNADKFFIDIMLNNLITNAIEASPEHGTVSIQLNTQKKENLLISIHNNGEIPQEVRSRFFQKYTTYGKPKGFGIGTYIAKLIACSHKGDISFTSSKQKGTTINIIIPVQ